MKKHDFDFEKILELNKHKIYRICNIYAVNPIEPQDLFQEVIFQIWKSLESFKGNASIDTWVYRITLNVCMRSKMKLDKQNAQIDRFNSIHIKSTSSEFNEEEKTRLNYLRECISILDEKDKSLVILYLEDLPYKEISTITGLSENHIAVKMKRIKAKLFECITAKIK